MPLRHVRVDATSPYERGRQRGVQVRDSIHRTWPVYQQLFAVSARDAGSAPPDVRGAAAASFDSLRRWSPDLAREIEGVADGAGVAVDVVMALNARTEILAQARGNGATECSTLVEMAGPSGSALAAQTWDWHDELAGGWHVQTVRGDEQSFVGLTEFAMLAKIGVNAAGVGVCFNLLRHGSDAAVPYGAVSSACDAVVPVHLVARAVLGSATTVAEAIDLMRSAPVHASTVVTVVTSGDAACVEMSPAGVGVVAPSDGWLVHTNHFLDPVLARGERVTDDVTTTFERADLLRSRVKGVSSPLDGEALVALLCAHDDDGVPVCRHAEPDAPTGYRTATLATVAVDPVARSVAISVGGPCRRTDITTLTAAP